MAGSLAYIQLIPDHSQLIAELNSSQSAFILEFTPHELPTHEEQALEIAKREEQDKQEFLQKLPFLAQLFPAAFQERLDQLLPDHSQSVGKGMSEEDFDDVPMERYRSNDLPEYDFLIHI